MRSEFENIPDDEPVFVLRAQDRTAPAVIQVWLTLQGSSLPAQKIGGALNVMEAMNKWPIKKAAD